MAGKTDDGGLSGIGDILKGFGKLLNTVVDMAEKDIPQKSASGELFKDRVESGLKGRYDFSVKMGLTEKDVVGLQGNPDVVVPQTDILKEEDRIIAVLEMCEIPIDHFSYKLNGNMLQLEGRGDRTLYKKDIDLEDFETTEELISVSENNGIFKVDITRKKGIE